MPVRSLSSSVLKWPDGRTVRRALADWAQQAVSGRDDVLRVGYFGSYARNTATPESDVDIVFDTDAPNLYMTVMLKEDLEALLGRPVDVLQLRGMTNARLRARIEKEAVYV